VHVHVHVDVDVHVHLNVHVHVHVQVRVTPTPCMCMCVSSYFICLHEKGEGRSDPVRGASEASSQLCCKSFNLI
jgi:hypothetical protein